MPTLVSRKSDRLLIKISQRVILTASKIPYIRATVETAQVQVPPQDIRAVWTQLRQQRHVNMKHRMTLRMHYYLPSFYLLTKPQTQSDSSKPS